MLGVRAVCSLGWTSSIGSCSNQPESQGRGQSRVNTKRKQYYINGEGLRGLLGLMHPLRISKNQRPFCPPKWAETYMHGILGYLSSSD